MSAKVDQFCDRLAGSAQRHRGWLESVKTHIQSLPEKARERSAEQTGRKPDAKLQAQKERVEQTRPTSSPAAADGRDRGGGQRVEGEARGAGAARLRGPAEAHAAAHHRPRRGQHRRGRGCHALRGRRPRLPAAGRQA